MLMQTNFYSANIKTHYIDTKLSAQILFPYFHNKGPYFFVKSKGTISLSGIL